MKDAAVLLSLSFALFSGGRAAAAPHDLFDQGAPDAGAVVKAAREDAARDRVQLAAGPASISRWDRDCEDLSFEGDRMLSDSVVLSATIWWQECQHIPPAGQICHEVPRGRETRQVRLKIEGRDPLPAGEKEVFQVCLDGWWLNARARKSTRKWSFEVPDRPEGLDFIITARPKKK